MLEHCINLKLLPYRLLYRSLASNSKTWNYYLADYCIGRWQATVKLKYIKPDPSSSEITELAKTPETQLPVTGRQYALGIWRCVVWMMIKLRRCQAVSPVSASQVLIIRLYSNSRNHIGCVYSLLEQDLMACKWFMKPLLFHILNYQKACVEE